MQRPAFVEIETISTEAMALEIVLGSGKRIRVPEGFDEDTLERVIAVLERK